MNVLDQIKVLSPVERALFRVILALLNVRTALLDTIQPIQHRRFAPFVLQVVNVFVPINCHFLADLEHIQIHQDHHVHRVRRIHMLQAVVNQRVMHVHLVSNVLNEIKHRGHVRLDLFEMLQ
jgi:hypothetical protein